MAHQHTYQTFTSEGQPVAKPKAVKPKTVKPVRFPEYGQESHIRKTEAQASYDAERQAEAERIKAAWANGEAKPWPTAEKPWPGYHQRVLAEVVRQIESRLMPDEDGADREFNELLREASQRLASAITNGRKVKKAKPKPLDLPMSKADKAMFDEVILPQAKRLGLV